MDAERALAVRAEVVQSLPAVAENYAPEVKPP
jgi:hypothetical protein